MDTVEQFGRFKMDYEKVTGIDCVEYVLPDGSVEVGPVFNSIPAVFSYDVHGYEMVEPVGKIQISSRYTPRICGRYHWRSLHAGTIVKEGSFDCVKSVRNGYINVSREDSRYFAYTDGTSYIPIGLNLVEPDYYQLPAGSAHFEKSRKQATPGCLSYERWFRQLSKNGGNYARIWLSSDYFETRTEIPGVHNLIGMARLDAVVELARKYGIMLKLCLEHFRTFQDTGRFFYRRMRDPETGDLMLDMEKWFNNTRWNEIWLKDISPYLACYWNDPIVFAWELWNEIDCVDARFDTVSNWTSRMIQEIRRISPLNLVTNSMGSFDDPSKREQQESFHEIAGNGIMQVHRYLDQGAPWDICRVDPVALSIDAIRLCQKADKPVILTETGAVNDRHIGLFRYCCCDHTGIIFHDVVYPAFFAGAASPGHIWHWNDYVEQKNLWKFFLPLRNILDGIAIDKEKFESHDSSTNYAWILTLDGKRHQLVYIRSKGSRWDVILRDNSQPALLDGLSLNMPNAATFELFWLCGENPGIAKAKDGKLHLPAFKYGCVVRITLPEDNTR
jgi:hypothetical protein